MKNTLLINPKTGLHIFGKIPEISLRGNYFHPGEIYLRHGEHWSDSRGFGAQHIWIKHEKELINFGYSSFEDVPRFISDIIVDKAPIHCEFENKGKQKISIVRSSTGMVFLEERNGRENEIFYSVITAFTGKQARGTKIGTVRL